jgi:opacity protein-like surface antigen
MFRLRLFLAMIVVFAAAASARPQDESRFLFNVGAGVGIPQSNLSSFVNDGANVVVGGGYAFTSKFGVDTEFMWQDLPINSRTKQFLQTPGASARQYAWTFNPIVHFPLGRHFGVYAIGGIGWYHRSGETTTPGVGVICDPYWSWWYGCTLGSVNVVTGRTSADAFGENIGGGLTFRLGEGRTKLYAEARYHHAGYNRVATDIVPLTFGIRW